MYVKNSMTNDGKDIYFTINAGWEAVEATSAGVGNNGYTGGLFQYTAGLDAQTVMLMFGLPHRYLMKSL